MPTYEYGCDACGNEWELEQRISEDPVKKCPKCRKARARRLISGTSFILKGGGWYSDLYSKPSGRSSGASSSESKRADTTKSEPPGATSSEPKPPKAASA